MSTHTPYLTEEQVFSLNEKHGWFQFGDAQSDVSKAFAQDAIAAHERIREAAADLLAELQAIADANPNNWDAPLNGTRSFQEWAQSRARAAVQKATGVAA